MKSNMSLSKFCIITFITILFSACHSLTIINDSIPQPSSSEIYKEDANLYHFYVGFLDFDNTVTNLCNQSPWQQVYIHREATNVALETASDSMLFALIFGKLLALNPVVSIGTQAVEGSPLIYKNTSITFTCNWL